MTPPEKIKWDGRGMTEVTIDRGQALVSASGSAVLLENEWIE